MRSTTSHLHETQLAPKRTRMTGKARHKTNRAQDNVADQLVKRLLHVDVALARHLKEGRIKDVAARARPSALDTTRSDSMSCPPALLKTNTTNGCDVDAKSTSRRMIADASTKDSRSVAEYL